MKKTWNIVIMLCTLAAAVFFWLGAGSRFLEMQSGAAELGPEETFGDAAGRYISYEAAYPIASCPEEYYSGDPDRVSSRGYLVYDEERETFVYIIVSEEDKRGLDRLMRGLEVVAEMRADRDMEPALITGTLEPMDQSAVDRALTALEESEVINLFADFQGEEAYQDAYFGDEYGQVTAKVSQAVLDGWRPADWYCIEYGVIDGVASSDIWMSVLAAGLSALIFVASLLSLFTGGGKKAGTKAGAGSKMDLFLEDQRAWVEEWCSYTRNRALRTNFLTVVCMAVILGVIGFLVKADVQRIMVFYLALGVFFGEVVTVFVWWIQKGQSKPGKILKKIGKSLRKQFPAVGAQDEIIEDFLHTDKEWIFQENGKDSMIYGKLGGRYWIAIYGTGAVTAVEKERLGRVESETESGSYRSGKVRVRYVSHMVKFFYQDTPVWENCDKSIVFKTVSGMDRFMDLAEKRAGDGVKITRRD